MLVPVLDKLLAAINKKLERQNEPQFQDPLYSHHVEVYRTKSADEYPIELARTYVTLTKPSLVRDLSDQGPDSTAIFDLTFKKNLGIDLRLPVLFQSMYIDEAGLKDETTGALYELDPEKRQGKGER